MLHYIDYDYDYDNDNDNDNDNDSDWYPGFDEDNRNLPV